MSSDRYISQNALITEIAKIHGNLNTKNVGQAIWDTPTADVAPIVHGEWVKKDLNNPLYESKQAPHCSICGEMSFIRYKYCPDCGAKMDGERREECK